MTVLVAYATCHGSTRGIAEKIGARLEAADLHVQVHAAGEMQDVGAYEAAVIGSAIHGGRWLPDGSDFVRQFGPHLRGRPVWLFSVSTLGDEESMFRPRVARRLRALRKDTDELLEFNRTVEPVEHRNFAGVAGRHDWPLMGRVFFWVAGGRYGDHRNWAAIDAWGDRIASHLLMLRPAEGESCPRKR